MFLSTKAVPAAERLIFALDVPSTDDAIHLVAALGETVSFYKLGLELFMAGGTSSSWTGWRSRTRRSW